MATTPLEAPAKRKKSTSPGDSPKAPPPFAAPALDMPKVPARRRPWGRWITIATVIGLLLLFAYFGLQRLGASSSPEAIVTYAVESRSFDVILNEKGELEAVNKIDIKNEVEGRTRIIYLVPEGKHVKEGELLFQLASDQIEEKIQQQELKESTARVSYEAAVKEDEIQKDKNASDIRKAEVALEIAKLKYEKYMEGDWDQQQKDADIDIERAEARLERAKYELENSKKLVEKKYIPQSDFLDDEFDLLEAENEIAKAKLAKKLLYDYTHKTDEAQFESDMNEAEKELVRVKKSAEANNAKSEANVQGKLTEWNLAKQQLEKYREQLAKCKVNAPSSGLVVYDNEQSRWGNSNRIAEGEEVYERQSILSIPDTTSMKVVVRIHEAKTDKLKLGQKARIVVEGVGNQELTGEVTKIAAVADSRNRWLNPDLKEYRTEITVEQKEANLKPGMTARASIFVESVDDALAVPVQAIYGKAGRMFAFVERGDEVAPIEVKVGRSNAEFVEILEGLAEGDDVHMVISDELKRLLPDDDGEAAPVVAPDEVAGAKRSRGGGRGGPRS